MEQPNHWLGYFTYYQGFRFNWSSIFSLANSSDDDPAFLLWVLKVMRKHARFILKVNYSCMKGKGFKFCIEVPIMVEDVLILDKQNVNILW